ncbi:MAG TPA: glycolate oxidase subunit GlcE [Gammaproteobacteria bacterium]|nr:glycolate oxidase subunit GlcE [Gammaproteobacteria bacterium]
MSSDISAQLQTAVREALAARTPLQIEGGGSKRFYGRSPHGTVISTAQHSGVINYEPTELVITARAGTPLNTIENLLAEQGQMLPFEPPHFGPGATLGGAIACGLSGPRRPYAGAVRDFVLGVKILTGQGDILTFGGQVMKNVAGFDASRLMAGALGTLGIILEASLKVLPRPAHEQTLTFECTSAEAIRNMNRWAALPLPISGAAYDGVHVYLRLSGGAAGVRQACAELGGTVHADAHHFWHQLREQQLPFFQGGGSLWRLSLPPATPPLALPGQWFIDWGGAQRWLRNPLPAEVIRATAARLGGHTMLFKRDETDAPHEIFQPLPPPLASIHRRLKAAFDPHGILNPGRLYANW